MRDTKPGFPLNRFLLGLAVLTVALASTNAARAGCLIADVPAEMVLPDGTVHPSGSIRICPLQSLSPVAELYETRIAGMPVGVFIARRQPAEAPDTGGRPFFVFNKTDRGLELKGCGYRVGDEFQSFRIEMIGPRKQRPHVVARDQFAEVPAPMTPTTVLLAAGVI